MLTGHVAPFKTIQITSTVPEKRDMTHCKSVRLWYGRKCLVSDTELHDILLQINLPSHGGSFQ